METMFQRKKEMKKSTQNYYFSILFGEKYDSSNFSLCIFKFIKWKYFKKTACGTFDTSLQMLDGVELELEVVVRREVTRQSAHIRIVLRQKHQAMKRAPSTDKPASRNLTQ